MGDWTFRPMVVADLSDLLMMQERGAVAGLAHIFPQGTHPFPRDRVLARWHDELDDPEIAAYVVTDVHDSIVGFAARRTDELLHFGTAVDSWGTGLATWLHDELVATYPAEISRLRLRVLAENQRARRFYEKLGWTSTGQKSRTSFPPHPVLVEYALNRTSTAPVASGVGG